MLGPVLQTLVGRLASASGENPFQEEGHEAGITTHPHSVQDALASMPTPDIQCIELDASMCFEQTSVDGSENSNLEPLDDFQLPPPAVCLDTDGAAGWPSFASQNNGGGATVASQNNGAPRVAAAAMEEVARFWSLGPPLVPDSVEGSSQAPTECWSLGPPLVPDSVEGSSQAPTEWDIEEEKATAGQELCESNRAVSCADQEKSAEALGHSGHSPTSCARKPAAPLPMPYGCTVRVGRRRVAVRRARHSGMAAKRDTGCGGRSHASRSRNRRQPQGAACYSIYCNQKHVIQRDRRI